jgi:hypothetical protein
MHRSLSPGEYWILTSAVRFKWSISELIEPDLEIQYNRRSHGMTVEEVAHTLAGLIERGLLEAERWSPTTDEYVRDRLSHDEVLPALHGQSGRMRYVLTAEGGAVWEAFAQPNWERYIAHKPSDDDPDLWTVTCMDRHLLTMYLYATAWVDRTPVVRTAEVCEIGEWPATYWKWLPRGYQVICPGPDFGPTVFADADDYHHRTTMFWGQCAIRNWWCPTVR